MKRISLLLLAFVLAGCQAFTRLPDTTSTQQNDDKTFQVEVPGGWVKHNFSGGDSLGLTKDGLSLQYIRVEKRGLEKPFAALDIKLDENDLISDVAAHYLADLQARHSGGSVEQESLQPVEIEGQDGFRLSQRHLGQLRSHAREQHACSRLHG